MSDSQSRHASAVGVARGGASDNGSDGGPSSPAGRTRALWSAVVGNVLEWYDFAVYGFLALTIAKEFFPAENETASLLATFAVFGIGFLVRPLGAIVIGRLGDVLGRKAALLLSLSLMALGSLMIGVLPTHATIGIAAPALLVLARLLQGFSAGGEWGSSTAFIVEWAPQNRRGLFSSFQQASIMGGLLLGSGVVALLSSIIAPDSVGAWGWRLPFLLGALLGLVGLYMRRNVEESPAFVESKLRPTPRPLKASLKLATMAFGFNILLTVAYYVLLTYMPTFTQRYLHLSRADALWSNTIGLIALVFLIPAAGALSDRYGRKRLLMTSCIAFIVLTYPLFRLMLALPSFGVIVGVQLIIAVIISLYSGPAPAALAEIFPTESRLTWMSVGYGLSATVFGGFAPLIATWLIGWTGTPTAPSFYLIAAAIASAVVIFKMKETASRELA